MNGCTSGQKNTNQAPLQHIPHPPRALCKGRMPFVVPVYPHGPNSQLNSAGKFPVYDVTIQRSQDSQYNFIGDDMIYFRGGAECEHELQGDNDWRMPHGGGAAWFCQLKTKVKFMAPKWAALLTLKADAEHNPFGGKQITAYPFPGADPFRMKTSFEDEAEEMRNLPWSLSVFEQIVAACSGWFPFPTLCMARFLFLNLSMLLCLTKWFIRDDMRWQVTSCLTICMTNHRHGH